MSIPAGCVLRVSRNYLGMSSYRPARLTPNREPMATCGACLERTEKDLLMTSDADFWVAAFNTSLRAGEKLREADMLMSR